MNWIKKRADLIDLVSLSKAIASQSNMTNGEACDFMTTKIKSLIEQEKGEDDLVWVTDWLGVGEVAIYDISGDTLPKKIESESAIDVVFEVFNTNWWKRENNAEVIAWQGKSASDFAIEKEIALSVFSLDETLHDKSENNKFSRPKIGTPQSETALPYSTPWLTIQQAAIAQFFNPRRNPDAKRDEVVEWIKQQAEKAGLPDSNNVATTIFTIIKPANHDPKKKRVEPLE